MIVEKLDWYVQSYRGGMAMWKDHANIKAKCSGAMQGNAIALEMLFNAVTPRKVWILQGGV
jgi:hypothetical protein